MVGVEGLKNVISGILDSTLFRTGVVFVTAADGMA